MTVRSRLSQAASDIWLAISVWSRNTKSRKVVVHDMDFEQYRALHNLWAFGAIEKPDFDMLECSAVIWVRCRIGIGQDWLDDVAEVDR